jgi:hypothetical protein
MRKLMMVSALLLGAALLPSVTLAQSDQMPMQNMPMPGGSGKTMEGHGHDMMHRHGGGMMQDMEGCPMMAQMASLEERLRRMETMMGIKPESGPAGSRDGSEVPKR